MMMRAIITLILALCLCTNAFCQNSQINLYFNLTGGPDDELKEGVEYTLEDLMEIKNISETDIEMAIPSPPPFLDCPVIMTNYCVVQIQVCHELSPILVFFSIDLEPNVCAGLFDGPGFQNEEDLYCGGYTESDFPKTIQFFSSCENQSNCMSFYGLATGSSYCSLSLSLQTFPVGNNCVPREVSEQLVCTEPVPTLSQWGLGILGLGLLIIGFIAVRQRLEKQSWVA